MIILNYLLHQLLFVVTRWKIFCSLHFFISAGSRWINEQNIWIKLNSGTKSNIGILHSMTLWSSQIHGSTSLFHLPRMESQNVRRKSLSWSTSLWNIEKDNKAISAGSFNYHEGQYFWSAQFKSLHWVHSLCPAFSRLPYKGSPRSQGRLFHSCKKILLLLKILRVRGCIVYRVYTI